jgi:2-polyprenyl-6-methoxyphenol hydroxylase-like FAD-dependent oxidoreductase
MASMSRAVVIGGSLAGLLAARALRDHVDEVVLVDRDTFPADAEPSQGRSQIRHLHLLLVRGAQIQWWPLPLARRSLDDKAGSSIHAAVLEVDARLAPQREKNRGYSRAAYERRTAAAAREVATPPA